MLVTHSRRLGYSGGLGKLARQSGRHPSATFYSARLLLYWWGTAGSDRWYDSQSWWYRRRCCRLLPRTIHCEEDCYISASFAFRSRFLRSRSPLSLFTDPGQLLSISCFFASSQRFWRLLRLTTRKLSSQVTSMYIWSVLTTASVSSSSILFIHSVSPSMSTRQPTTKRASWTSLSLDWILVLKIFWSTRRSSRIAVSSPVSSQSWALLGLSSTLEISGVGRVSIVKPS